jgi:hypothetical protein
MSEFHNRACSTLLMVCLAGLSSDDCAAQWPVAQLGSVQEVKAGHFLMEVAAPWTETEDGAHLDLHGASASAAREVCAGKPWVLLAETAHETDRGSVPMIERWRQVVRCDQTASAPPSEDMWNFKFRLALQERALSGRGAAKMVEAHGDVSFLVLQTAEEGAIPVSLMWVDGIVTMKIAHGLDGDRPLVLRGSRIRLGTGDCDWMIRAEGENLADWIELKQPGGACKRPDASN